ncbi:hypothetical protein ABT269_05380 [Streptomyces viridosporus]|uniref:hypothetical protein n=1 Tax=Streptomyces viridosporus TaxID=67581 RepID=UPI00332A6B28
MRTLAEGYPERSSRPLTVMAPAGRADAVLEEVRATEGVAEATTGRSGGGPPVRAGPGAGEAGPRSP